MNTSDNSGTTSVSSDLEAAEAAYNQALRDPGRHADDPYEAARVVVAIDNAREAFRALGGVPGSHWSLPSRAECIEARELLGEDVAQRRAEMEAEMAAARDALGLGR